MSIGDSSSNSSPKLTAGVRRISAVILLLSAVAMLVLASARRAGETPSPISMRIDVNTATIDELRLLPGIGPALAERIAADRDARGPFSSIDDLTRVRGVGERTVLSLRPFVEIAAPAPTGELN